VATENAPYVMTAKAGDTFERVLTWTSQVGGAPIDLTDASVEWSLRNGDTVLSYFDAPQVVITDATAGEITLTLSDVETRTMHEAHLNRKWSYEVTVTMADGTRTTLLEGSIRMRDEVANSES
jgi:archaellin